MDHAAGQRLHDRTAACALALLLLLAAALTAACSRHEEPHGSPVLLSVQWISGAGKTQVWTPTETATVQVPAAGQEVDFVFDRLLDGTRIEDIVTQNGVETTVPKATPPITTSWPDAATVMSTPPFSDQVRYNSEPFYGAGDLLRPAAAGGGRVPLLEHDHLLARSDQPDQRVRRTDDRARERSR